MSRKNPESSPITRNRVIAALAALTVAAGVGAGVEVLHGDGEHSQDHTAPQSIKKQYPDIIIEPAHVPLGPLQPRVENRDSR